MAAAIAYIQRNYLSVAESTIRTDLGLSVTQAASQAEALYREVDPNAGGAIFGGGSGAQFFGVEARGSRFAYVLDISGSMAGERIELLQRALAASLGGLLDHASFAVVMYNHNALPLGQPGAWTIAGPNAVSATLSAFNSVRPLGATNPVPAFERVMQLSPPPDAIYFMTDGAFSSDVEEALLNIINAAVRPNRVPVHCIMLVERDAAPTMEEIARRTNGTSTHVEGTQN